jgi:hypothetical protein
MNVKHCRNLGLLAMALCDHGKRHYVTMPSGLPESTTRPASASTPLSTTVPAVKLGVFGSQSSEVLGQNSELMTCNFGCLRFYTFSNPSQLFRASILSDFVVCEPFASSGRCLTLSCSTHFLWLPSCLYFRPPSTLCSCNTCSSCCGNCSASSTFSV